MMRSGVAARARVDSTTTASRHEVGLEVTRTTARILGTYSREIAGSWLVSAAGAASGTTLDGAAIVPPDQVASVVIENENGAQYVTAVRA